MSDIRSVRLRVSDRERARELFSMMARVFDEPAEALSDEYLERLLAREEFWVIAAWVGEQIVGGITAHTLPMTRAATSELFIYDLAVRSDQQRKGVGRHLLRALRAAAAAAGIVDSFVPADNDDTHALDFYRALGGAPASVTVFTFSG